MSFLTQDRPDHYYSTVGGVTVGWDVCGECHHHVARCECADGPSEPAYLAAERVAQDPPIAPAPRHAAAA